MLEDIGLLIRQMSEINKTPHHIEIHRDAWHEFQSILAIWMDCDYDRWNKLHSMVFGLPVVRRTTIGQCWRICDANGDCFWIENHDHMMEPDPLNELFAGDTRL